MSARNAQFNKPINTNVSRPDINPLDASTPIQNSTQARLAADDGTEAQTTPEASLGHIDLDPDAEPNASEATSQSTLSGATFHPTHRDTKLGDGDESQSWQIRETQRGTGHTEH